MKKISDILTKITAADLAGSVQRATQFAHIENALRQILAEEGFDEIDCRVSSLNGGELFVATENAPACARLRQMRRVMLAKLQLKFPQIKYLRFGIQP